jgi:hypothetical protein
VLHGYNCQLQPVTLPAAQQWVSIRLLFYESAFPEGCPALARLWIWLPAALLVTLMLPLLLTLLLPAPCAVNCRVISWHSAPPSFL